MHLFQEHSKWSGKSAEKLSTAFAADFDPSQGCLALSLQFENHDEGRPLSRTRLAVSDYISAILLDFDNRILGDAELRGSKRTSVMTSIDQMESAKYWNANIVLQITCTGTSNFEKVVLSLLGALYGRDILNKVHLFKTDIEHLNWAKSILSIAGLNPKTLDGSNTFLTKYQ